MARNDNYGSSPAFWEMWSEFPGLTIQEVRDAVRAWRERPLMDVEQILVLYREHDKRLIDLQEKYNGVRERLDELERRVDHHDHPYPEACQDTRTNLHDLVRRVGGLERHVGNETLHRKPLFKIVCGVCNEEFGTCGCNSTYGGW